MSELNMYVGDETCIKNVEWKYGGKKLQRVLKTQWKIILKIVTRTSYD